jgi:hypothetical protein
MKSLLHAFAIVFYSGVGAVSAAPISYNADATATVTITSISPTPLPADIFIINAPLPSVSPPLEATTGNATVMTDGSANGLGNPDALGVGDGYFNSTSASGTANIPAPSSSFAFSLASGQILIDNENNDVSVTVDFLLSYSLSASASINDPVTGDAFAFSDVQLNWEPTSGTFDFFVDAADSDDRFGNPTSVDTSFAFSVTVLPGDVGNASLQTASSGDVEVVPTDDSFFVVPLRNGKAVIFSL